MSGFEPPIAWLDHLGWQPPGDLRYGKPGKKYSGHVWHGKWSESLKEIVDFEGTKAHQNGNTLEMSMFNLFQDHTIQTYVCIYI